MEKHAWVITKDHLYKSALPDIFDNEAGTVGPSEADIRLVAALSVTRYPKPPNGVYRHTFNMYDDDGILYYTGRLATYTDNPSEEELMAPLYDFGGPNAGAVVIKYKNHPEWTIEY